MSNETLDQINSYLSFKLGGETFAANVGKILNILEMTEITKVPKAPDYMKGVINLRGTVLPVVDTRIKFGMPPAEYTNNTCILVMEVEVDGEQVQVGDLSMRFRQYLRSKRMRSFPLPALEANTGLNLLPALQKLTTSSSCC
jgi:purine-binding chemotaxis protein CheW